MINLVIRKYLPSDRESCRRLWKELTEKHRQIYHDPSIGGSTPEDDFDIHLAKVGNDNLWVAILDSTVVSLTGLIIQEEEAEIEPLIVSQLYRNRGIGKKMIETVIEEAKGLNLKFLNVKPVARNIEAITFFYNRGFINLGHIELFMDLSNKEWKKGPKLFDQQFNY
jgi:GNAT superfamily N-acetyltransferase